MKELWRDIKGYKGYYQVSNLGRIKSLERKCKTSKGERTVPEKIKKLGNDKNKYKIITLYKQGTNKTFKVHRLVAEAFIPNVNNLSQVNHKDENKWNNLADNLEWCDLGYNVNYGSRNERIRKVQQKAIIQKTLDGEFVKLWVGMNHMCRETGYEQSLISKVCNGKRLSGYGYKWEFEKQGNTVPSLEKGRCND